MTALKTQEVRVRIAPSPTGPFHFGTARTALFNWLFARKHKGEFIVRIEDTDKERSDKKFEREIIEGLLWLGLDFDEGPDKDGAYGPYRQSERISIYRSHLTKLIEEKKAYYCYCSKEELEAQRQAMLAEGLPPRYGGHCRERKAPSERMPSVVRFKMPDTTVEFKDIIRGHLKFDASLFGDIVIAKDLESPLYNFAAVVDDEAMHISHVIRGEDHLPNTPKQILLGHALGFRTLVYAHLPLILGADRSKLSKRHLETSLLEYRRMGHLPEAIVNFLALLGWHPKDEKEIFSAEELIQIFDLKRVQKAGAIFSEEKLEWVNTEHLRALDEETFADKLQEFSGGAHHNVFRDREFLKKVIRIERVRAKNFADFLESSRFFFELPDYEANLLIWQRAPREKIRKILEELNRLLKEKSVAFTRASLQSALAELLAREGRGEVLWPFRVALSGRAASPDPLDIAEILGHNESMRRLKVAIDKLGPSGLL